MCIKQDIDGIRISETDNNRYVNTRKRLIGFTHNEYISDKEIIEYLAEEIEQYRERIRKQNEIIDELSRKEIQKEEVELDTTYDEVIDEDITEIISTTHYADGKPIISRMEYKYKESNNKQEESTCPPIKIGTTKAY